MVLFISFKVLKGVKCRHGAVLVATIFSTWLTVPWQWYILDYRLKNKWRMLQTAPPLPHSLCRDPAPLRSIWGMRPFSRSPLNTPSPQTGHTWGGEVKWKREIIRHGTFQQWTVTFPRAAWKEILGWLVREENWQTT